MSSIPRDVHFFRVTNSQGAPHNFRWKQFLTRVHEEEGLNEIDGDTDEPIRIYVNAIEDDRCTFSLSKIRKGKLPSIRDDDGSTEPLGIARTQGLDESSHIVVSSGRLACEYNHYAPRPQILKRFIDLVTGAGAAGLKLSQYVETDPLARIVNDAKVMKVRLKLPARLVQLLSDAEPTLKNAMNEINNRYGSEELEITLKVRRSTKRNPSALNQRVLSMLRAVVPILTPYKKEAAVDAVVKEEDSKQELLSLLGEPIIDTISINTVDQRSRSVSSSNAYLRLAECLAANMARLDGGVLL